MQNQNQEQPNYNYVPPTPFEYIANQIPKNALRFWILAIAGTIGSIGLAFTTIFIVGNNDLITILINTIQIIISLTFLLLTTLMYKYSIKKGDRIILREHRGGLFSFNKIPLKQKIMFNPKDPSTEPTILWNGTGTEPQSGAKVIYLKEGGKSNTNINLDVAESDWAKNLANMVRAKQFADIAEADLLNGTTLLGMKWQDIVLVITALLALGTIISILGIAPNMIAQETITQMLDGTLQQAISSIVLK